ncbi:hypothetical protein MYAM1_001922 [Malassezia yamatoensis]|uniref:Uncharacterized protein n=1 Tax=Malassezia yamatoensis TaxID=253288 RepID=A0AAJ6CHU6_9BASI|nr:hypothetical protein MYAM1_001922 [Malassezia yamatoensis]
MDTYLALRWSADELQEIPEASIVKLINDCGNGGLSGIIQNITTDLLNGTLAKAGTHRRRRLLIALLAMNSSCHHTLRMDPKVISVITYALAEESDAFAQELAPFVAAHVLNMLLKVLVFNGPQISMIRPLFDRLLTTGEFPDANEGFHVLEYLLEYSDQLPEDLIGIVSQTMHQNAQVLGQQTMQQARADGSLWQIWAESQSDSLMPTNRKALLSSALRITLWSLCCRTWLRLQRATRFRHALHRLLQAMTEADQIVLQVQQPITPSPTSSIIRALLQTHLVHLANLSSANAIAAGVKCMAEFPTISPDLLPRVLALILAKAVDFHRLDLAENLLQLPIFAQDRESSYFRALFQHLGPSTTLRVLRHLAEYHKFADLRVVFRLLSKSFQDTEWDSFWPTSLRSELITWVAVAEMDQETIDLCKRWMGSLQMIAMDDRRRWIHCTEDRLVAADSSIMSVMQRLSLLLEQRGDNPLFHEAISHSEPTNTIDSPPSMLFTAPCILAVVKLLARSPRFASPINLPFAIMVRDKYLTSSALEHRSRQELTALAQASFVVGDRTAGASLFRQIFKHGIDASAFAVLLRGAADADIENAVEIFLSMPDSSDSTEFKKNARLYSVLISRCVHQCRFDLSDKLYAAGRSLGLSGQIESTAHSTLLANSNLPPQAVLRKIQSLMDEGWKPEMRLINWGVKSMVRGYTLRETGSAPNPVSDQGLTSAVKLLLLGTDRMQFIDLSVTRFLLYHLTDALRNKQMSMKNIKRQWTTILDKITHALRWTRHITGVSTYAKLEKLPLEKIIVSIRPKPNALPLPMLFQLANAYDTVGDLRGVAAMLVWIETSYQSDIPYLNTRQAKNLRRIRRRAQPFADIHPTKTWWNATSFSLRS